MVVSSLNWLQAVIWELKFKCLIRLDIAKVFTPPRGEGGGKNITAVPPTVTVGYASNRAYHQLPHHLALDMFMRPCVR